MKAGVNDYRRKGRRKSQEECHQEEESQLIYPERKPGKKRRKPDPASQRNLSSPGDSVSISFPNPIYPGWRVDSASPAFFYTDVY